MASKDLRHDVVSAYLAASSSCSAITLCAAHTPCRVLWARLPSTAGLAHTALPACNEGPFTPRPVYMFSLSHFSSQLEIHFLQETFPDRRSELASLPSCYVLCKYIEVHPWIGLSHSS